MYTRLGELRKGWWKGREVEWTERAQDARDKANTESRHQLYHARARLKDLIGKKRKKETRMVMTDCERRGGPGSFRNSSA